MTAIVRPYQPADREALLQIGADTAFFGAPIERYMEDRRVFIDAFFTYYTDYEPQHAWVAADGSQVLGFLTGCIDSTVHDRTRTRKIVPRVAWRALRGYYHLGPKFWRYIRSAAGAALRREIPSADLSHYPAHLHINLLPPARGQGLGRKLIEAYCCQLTALGVPGVHLQTTSYNVTACHLYERVGFHLLGARRTRMFDWLVDQPVEMRCYGMELI